MTRSPNRTFFVARDPGGGWSVTSSGAGAAKTFGTKEAALDAARQMVRERGGVLKVRDSDGETSSSFTLGRAAMAKLNAVEGVVLGQAGRLAFKEFDREGLTPPQRRARLQKDLTKLAAGTTGTASRRMATAKSSKA